MYFSYDQTSLSNLYALDASEVREIIKMNRNGIKPESLQTEPEPSVPEFVTAVGDDSITRFDESRRRRKKKKSPKNNNAPADQESAQKPQEASQRQQDGGQRRPDKRQWQKRDKRQKPQQSAKGEDAPAKPAENN